jgi:gamma-glutamyltranspeptidase/glutathione hydrolase
MVVSQSRDAALAGIAILDAGGNAIDAAVGTALALAAVEPWNSGLGGIGFAVVHRAGQSAAETVDFGPVAPVGLKPDLFRLTGRMKQDLFAWPEVEGDANIHGPLSFVVPSAVAGYAHMHGRFGVLPLSEVMAPAIALAKRGLSQDWFTTLKIANSASVLRLYPSSAEIYLPNGLPPVAPYQGAPGFLKLGALADTLDRLSHAGLRDFYEGDVATSLAADIAALGGLLDAEDRIVPVEEFALENRVLQVAAGLTAGPTLIHVLRAMTDIPRAAMPDAAWFAALARTMKAAYADRLATGGESKLIENEPREAESCTTHLTVCDEAGTMVAMTTTLLSSMGSRLVLPKSGVLMNNGVMWFDPRPGQPNSAAPGKRPLTNMCPVVVRADGAPVLATGSSGGRRIMASVAQMLAFTGDFGMDPATAAHHPRIDVSDPGSVNADARLPPDVLAALKADGEVAVVEHGVLPVNFACPNVIVQRDGERTGISDVMSPWSAALAQA